MDTVTVAIATFAAVFVFGGFQLLHLKKLRPLVPDAARQAAAGLDAPQPPILVAGEWLIYYRAKSRMTVSVIAIIVGGAVCTVAVRNCSGTCRTMSVDCDSLIAQLDFKSTGEHSAKFCKDDVDVVSCGTDNSALYTFHPKTDDPPPDDVPLSPSSMSLEPVPLPILPAFIDAGVQRDDGVLADGGNGSEVTITADTDMQTVSFTCDSQDIILTSKSTRVTAAPSIERATAFSLIARGRLDDVFVCNEGACYSPFWFSFEPEIDRDAYWYTVRLLLDDANLPGRIRRLYRFGISIETRDIGSVHFYARSDRSRPLTCKDGIERLRADQRLDDRGVLRLTWIN